MNTTSLAVIMLTYNEAHHIRAAIESLHGLATEIFIVDSYSTDETVDIAIRMGAHVTQRPFRDFGDQWNFALSELPITSKWTMKMDPDERPSNALKASLIQIMSSDVNGVHVERRNWFMGSPLGSTMMLLRVWRTGYCHFTDVSVNEYPVVDGEKCTAAGHLEHLDSPSLHHWINKQNRYTTAEALIRLHNQPLAAEPRLFGSPIERAMWVKKIFYSIPLRYSILWLVLLWKGRFWRAPAATMRWSTARVMVYRLVEYKTTEMSKGGSVFGLPPNPRGAPHPLASQASV